MTLQPQNHGTDQNKETTHFSAISSEICVLHFGMGACQLAADQPKPDTEKQNYTSGDVL